MAGLGSLFIDLLARTGKFETDIGRAARVAEKRAKEIERSFSRLGSRITGALGGIAAGFSLRAVIDATAQAEKAMGALEVAVKNNSGAAGVTAAELAGMASELQKLSTFDDEAIMGMQALLLTFKQIGGAELTRAQTAVIDLSTALGQDLNSAAMLVGRALADPVAGMKRLSRAGIVLTDDQKNLVKQLVETGKRTQAQNYLLEQLEARFGGAAEAARSKFGGALIGVKNAFGDLLEAKGGLPEATEELNELSRLLQDPETVAAAGALTSALVSGFTKSAKAIADTVNVMRFVGESAAAALNGAASDDIVRLEDQLAKLQELRSMNWAHPDFMDRLRFFGKDGLVEWYSDKDLDKAIAEIQEHIKSFYKNSAAPPVIQLPSAGGTSSSFETPPSEEFVKLSDKLKEQIALYGKVGKAAEIAYAIQSGALDELSSKEQQQYLALGRQYDAVVKVEDAKKKAGEEQKKAEEEIRKMIRAAEEEIATLGKGEAAVVAYRLAHGELVKAFPESTAASEELGKTVDALISKMESMDAAAINAARSTVDLAENAQKKAAESSSDLKQQLIDVTLQLQILKEAADGAAEAISDFGQQNTQSLNQSLEAFEADFEERFIKGVDKLTVFQEQAARNTQDIIADTLMNGFDKGVDGILKSFGDMIIKLAAQAVAADIAGKLFGAAGGGTGGGWVGMAAGWLGGLAGNRAIGGPVLAGMNYRVNEREPEFFRPRVGGDIIPLSKMNVGSGMSLVQHFTVKPETGDRVTRRTEQQIAAAASRGLALAGRRNN